MMIHGSYVWCVEIEQLHACLKDGDLQNIAYRETAEWIMNTLFWMINIVTTGVNNMWILKNSTNLLSS